MLSLTSWKRSKPQPESQDPIEKNPKLPWGARWRSSDWFVTMMVCIAVMTNKMAYTVLVPCYPFRFAALGYPHDVISGHVSYLLVTLTASAALANPLLAWFPHRRNFRQGPLLLASVLTQGSLVAQLLAQPFWALVLARILQGVCSAVISTLGLTIINENVSLKRVGRCIGFGLAGGNLGLALGPPIGGILYGRLGWHAPFIALFALSGFDVALRVLIVQRTRYPQLMATRDKAINEEAEIRSGSGPGAIRVGWTPDDIEQGTSDISVPNDTPERPIDVASIDASESKECPMEETSSGEDNVGAVDVGQKESPPLWRVIRQIFCTPRILACFLVAFTCPAIYMGTETVVTLRLHDVWGKDSSFAGLIYLAAGGGTILMAILTGFTADRLGPAIVIPICMMSSLFWVAFMLPKFSLALFCTSLCIYDTVSSGVFAPMGRELGVIGRTTDGVSILPLMAMQNMFQQSGAVVGALMAGAIYDRWSDSFGWTLLNSLWVGMLALPLPLVFFYMGEVTLAAMLRKLVTKRELPQVSV